MRGGFVECMLDYPEALHDLHADYLLLHVKTKIRCTHFLPIADFF